MAIPTRLNTAAQMTIHTAYNLVVPSTVALMDSVKRIHLAAQAFLVVTVQYR